MIPGTPVPLHEVERELSRQMAAVQGNKDGRVHRARMSNVIVYCSRPEEAAAIQDELPSIEAVHPARVLMLIGDAAAGNQLEARVQVARVPVERQELCCEQVTVYAQSSAIHCLPFAVRSLLIGDLPTNLWWATNLPPPLAGGVCYELTEQAQQILYDSQGWLEPARAVAATVSWLGQVERGLGDQRWRVAADLSWRRLKYWRRLLAQSLDADSAPGALASITEVSIEHGPHAVIQAWELISWLACRLGWKVEAGKVEPAVEITWRFRAGLDHVRVHIRRLPEGPPRILKLRIACSINGKPTTLTMTRESDLRLSVSVGDSATAPRTISMPPQSPGDLVGRQFSDREPDRVFRESMAVARVLAESVLS